MTLEEKIAALPTAIRLIDLENGNDGWAGLCIRYRPKIKKWYCGYGANNTGKARVLGNTPEEAVDMFNDFLKKYGKK